MRFSRTPWGAAGVTTIESTGSTAQEALEAGLRAVLAQVVPSSDASQSGDKFAPVNGEGPDLAALFADMTEALLEQIEFYGSGLEDIAVDGVLRRDDGGYLAWGYVMGTLESLPPASMEIPRLLEAPAVREESNGVYIRAVLRRPSHT